MVEHHFETMRYCVKTYLSHMRHYWDDIREIELRIRMVKDRLDLIGVAYDKINVSTSTEGDTIGNGLATLEELTQEWKDRVTTYERLFQEAQDICQPRYVGRYALWLHEVEGREWTYVGRVIGYEERQARRIAEGGIREIYELMPEEYRRNAVPDAL